MMLAADTAFESRTVSQRLAVPLIVLSLFFAVVANAEKLELSDSYFDQLLTDEMYKDEVEWRPPPANESGWRSGIQSQKQGSRIQFGYDSAYEEMLSRDYDANRGASFGLERTKPNTLLRINF